MKYCDNKKKILSIVDHRYGNKIKIMMHGNFFFGHRMLNYLIFGSQIYMDKSVQYCQNTHIDLDHNSM